MKKSKLAYLFLLTALIFCLYGCGQEQSSNKNNNSDFASNKTNADETLPSNENVMDDVSDGVNDAIDGVTDAVDDIGNATGDIINETGDAVKDVTDDVTTGLDNATDSANQAAKKVTR